MYTRLTRIPERLLMLPARQIHDLIVQHGLHPSACFTQVMGTASLLPCCIVCAFGMYLWWHCRVAALHISTESDLCFDGGLCRSGLCHDYHLHSHASMHPKSFPPLLSVHSCMVACDTQMMLHSSRPEDTGRALCLLSLPEVQLLSSKQAMVMAL